MPEKEAQHHRDAGEMPVNSTSANLLKWLKTDKNHGPTQLLVTMQRNRDPHKRQWEWEGSRHAGTWSGSFIELSTSLPRHPATPLLKFPARENLNVHTQTCTQVFRPHCSLPITGRKQIVHWQEKA